ncbi:hypothetical protein BJ508DRAFT_232226 [Ascobolus immersus RN42]|uniref:F-box domain-containing protein n=1 Tax=Ascobolus immersus RN42 TaxID=1160509 RepID=A0A3N4HED6_ASCIM|nr:hypothetical protein BJ508DRAFT_232226 [Ascobolus immersus RN42]
MGPHPRDHDTDSPRYSIFGGHLSSTSIFGGPGPSSPQPDASPSSTPALTTSIFGGAAPPSPPHSDESSSSHDEYARLTTTASRLSTLISDLTTEVDAIQRTYEAAEGLADHSDDEAHPVRAGIALPSDEEAARLRPNAPFLPLELVDAILGFVYSETAAGNREQRWKTQRTLATCGAVSRLWYHASLKYLYRAPIITVLNYAPFILTVCPGISHARHSPLSDYIHHLDLSRAHDDGRSSMLSRLIRHTQRNLRTLVAPRGAFTQACYIALSHSRCLEVLDLSCLFVSVNLVDLMRIVASLGTLRSLKLPRSYTSRNSDGEASHTWPERLQSLSVSGNINNNFFALSPPPATLEELHISHCPFVRYDTIKHLLTRLSPQLTTLEINNSLPCLPFDACNKLLPLLPNLTRLHVAVDFITSHFFDEDNAPATHPLYSLSLDSSGVQGVEKKVSPDEIFIALAGGGLGALRVLRLSKVLRWEEEVREDVEDLAVIFSERIERDKEEGISTVEREAEAGVWGF